MTSQQILQSDLLDILFERRNKLYGAYHLRRSYNSHLLKAIGGTTLLVGGLLFLGTSSTEAPGPENESRDLQLTPVILPYEKKPEPIKLKSQPPQMPRQIKQENFNTNLQVVNDPIDPVATQDQLQHTTIGSGKINGSDFIGIQTPPLPTSGIGGKETLSEKETVQPSRQPQFPGGEEAWLKFLNVHLHAPQELDAGEKRTVLIRFSVDEEGIITNFQVMHSCGSAFDHEVIRVLKKMPRWLPALQSGKPIAVSFTQPVTFAASED